MRSDGLGPRGPVARRCGIVKACHRIGKTDSPRTAAARIVAHHSSQWTGAGPLAFLSASEKRLSGCLAADVKAGPGGGWTKKKRAVQAALFADTHANGQRETVDRTSPLRLISLMFLAVSALGFRWGHRMAFLSANSQAVVTKCAACIVPTERPNTSHTLSIRKLCTRDSQEKGSPATFSVCQIARDSHTETTRRTIHIIQCFRHSSSRSARNITARETL